MAIYESEHTRFMREWLEKHPQEIAQQQKGRALWWDKAQQTDVRARNDDSRVPVKAYYYDTNH